MGMACSISFCNYYANVCASFSFLFFWFSYNRFHLCWYCSCLSSLLFNNLEMPFAVGNAVLALGRCSANLLCGTVRVRKCNMLRCWCCSVFYFPVDAVLTFSRFSKPFVICLHLPFEHNILLQLFCKSFFDFSRDDMPGHGMIHFILQLLCKPMRSFLLVVVVQPFSFVALPLFNKPCVSQLVYAVRC